MEYAQLADNVVVYLADNQELMASTKIKFNAIITDPPYGINYKKGREGKEKTIHINRKPIIGDDKPFDPIWLLSLLGKDSTMHNTRTIALAMLGANYFAQYIPTHTGSWFCWDKSCGQGPQNSFVDAEFGWINRVVKRCVFHHFWMGCLRAGQDGSENTKRQHPSMKPVELMAWMMQQARVGLGKIVLDPYMGSGSTGVACVQTGRGFVGIEIDPEYYAIAKERISRTINLQKECLQFEVAEVESPA